MKQNFLIFLVAGLIAVGFGSAFFAYNSSVSIQRFVSSEMSSLGERIDYLKKRQDELKIENPADLSLLADAEKNIPEKEQGGELSITKQANDWMAGLNFLEKNSLISKHQLADRSKLSFKWSDSEIENNLTIDHGEVSWNSLHDFPPICPTGQFMQGVDGTLLCAEPSVLNWSFLQAYPDGCAVNQAVQTIGDVLTCVDLPTAESVLFTDGGGVTYLDSQSDDLALGGIDSGAPFYFSAGTGQLSLNNLKTGGATDNLTVSSSGELKLNGNAIVWDDLRVPVTSTKTGGSKDPGFSVFADDGAGSQGVFTYNFDSAIEEELYFTVQLPHGYKPGSDIKPHVHWAPTTTGAGNVVWGLEYTWTNINQAFGNTSTIEITDAADGVLRKQQIVSFPTISGTGKNESSSLVCRIFRKAVDGADTYASDAALLEVDVHFEIEKIGTADEF